MFTGCLHKFVNGLKTWTEETPVNENRTTKCSKILAVQLTEIIAWSLGALWIVAPSTSNGIQPPKNWIARDHCGTWPYLMVTILTELVKQKT